MSGLAPSANAPTFPQALRLWLKIGLLSFGGPAAQIALLHDEVVEKRKWVADDRFQHALRYATFLPGPEAQQLATCCGWYLHGIPGGLAAGILFFLPAAVLLWALSWIYAAYGQVAQVNAVFHGLKAAILALILTAVIRLAKKSLKGYGAYAIAIAALIALDAGAPFPIVIGLAALSGWLLSRSRWHRLLLPISTVKDEDLPESPTRWGVWTALLFGGLALWATPVVGAWLCLGPKHWLTQEGLFFSKAACVTFGGAYAVLPYVADHAVATHWVTQAQVPDGLALAETTPGPLIIVLEFFGFQGGWNAVRVLPDAWSPLFSGTLGACMTVWTTFIPSTFFALLGAPHLEKTRRIRWLTGALAGISAAVVGVIALLGISVLTQTVWPGYARIDGFVLVVAGIAFYGMQWRKWGMLPVLLACGVAGLGWHILFNLF